MDLVTLVLAEPDPEGEIRARQRVIHRIPDEGDRLIVLQALGLEP